MESKKKNDADATYLAVSGFFEANDNMVLYPLYWIYDQRLGTPDSKGTYLLELRDDADNILNTFRFGTVDMHVVQKDGSDLASPSGYFAFTVPFDNQTRRVVIRHQGQERWQTIRSLHSPSIEAILQARLTKNSTRLTVEWEAGDPDGDTLFFFLEYSKDDGRTWDPLTGLFRDKKIEIDVSGFASITAHPDSRINLVCTDGLNTVRKSIRIDGY
jgi:hypothetical protein